jgi:16S rRNA (cytidine1402-2'-O)-methyltransferase
MVFYETPHRLEATLRDMLAAFGVRRASLSRELTKLHEETLRGSLPDLVDCASRRAPRGEYVIVVAGAPAARSGDEGSHAEHPVLPGGSSRHA